MSNNGDQSAFPVGHGNEFQGLTKREYVASLILQGIITEGSLAIMGTEAISEVAISYTNSLLKALERKEE